MTVVLVCDWCGQRYSPPASARRDQLVEMAGRGCDRCGCPQLEIVEHGPRADMDVNDERRSR